MKVNRLGVVLFQLGGPDTFEAIEPFLYNLFCDPDIIDFPFARLGRRPLAKLISSTRAQRVRHHYSAIGGGSPIRRNTERQAQALEAELQDRGFDARCFVAMRYWHPFTAEAVAALEREPCSDIVLLPLYPQYSSTTTGSSLNEWNRRYRQNGAVVHLISDFYRHERYLEAVVDAIDRTLQRFDVPSRPELIFSAHSVPTAVVERGDPYQKQIEQTVGLLMQRGDWASNYRLCYQSKVGASSWLQPTLTGTVRQLAKEQIREVCVVPVSFVSDHVETLGEIDHTARELATKLGITRFEMVPGLNDSPVFISALADLVLDAAGVKEQQLLAAD